MYVNQAGSELIGNKSGALAVGASSAVGVFDVVAPGGASFTSVLSGNITGSMIIAPTAVSAAEVNVQSNDIDISAPVVGTTKVSLLANGTRSVGINAPGSTSSDYNLSTAELALINTGTLRVGSLISNSGPVTLSAAYTAPATGAGLFNLALETASAFDGSGGSFNAGSKTISISAAGNLRTGSLTSTNTITLVSTGDLSSVGTVNGATVNLDGKTVTIEGTVTSSVLTNVSASTGDMRTTGAGLVSGDFVEIVALNGSVGTGANDRVSTSSNKLLVRAFKGNVYLNQNKAVTVGSSEAGKTFDLVCAGQITTAQQISTSAGLLFGNTIAIKGTEVGLTASSGNIRINASVAATSTHFDVGCRCGTGCHLHRR